MNFANVYKPYGKRNMVIRIIKYLIVIPAVLLLLASRCASSGDKIKGIPLTHFYDSCDLDAYFGEMITIGDPNERFFISLPYSWDIRESYTDNVYGMYASNFLSIPIEIKDRQAVMITGYETELSLEDYFLNELKDLKKDEAVELLEAGTVEIDDRNCNWLLFHNYAEHPIYHVVVYTKKENSNEIYLLQSMTFDTENYRDRLCYLKRIIKSFDIEED